MSGYPWIFWAAVIVASVAEIVTLLFIGYLAGLYVSFRNVRNFESAMKKADRMFMELKARVGE